jgi:hypothetical protein
VGAPNPKPVTSPKAKPAAAPKASPDVQDAFICLPGQAVECHRTKGKVRVILRKHRDVLFDINLKKGALYTVEATSDFYCYRDKKIKRSVQFKDGERLNLWISRDFAGSLVLKTEGRILGDYPVNRFDTYNYGFDPQAKPEPFMVVMGHNPSSSMLLTAEDPYGFASTQRLFKPWLSPKLGSMSDFGSQFAYNETPEPDIQEYMAVTEAQAHEIQPQVLKQLASGVAVTGGPLEIFVAPKPDQPQSLLTTALGLTVAFVSSNPFKETAGYLFEHRKMLDSRWMKVFIEQKEKGKFRVLLKGHSMTTLNALKAGVITKLPKPAHISVPLGTPQSAFLDGSFSRTGSKGYGGFKRIISTCVKNGRAGLKVQAIGTVIDLVIDVHTVFYDEKGSHDVSEFIGRATVSLLKAGATALIGSMAAAGIVAGIAAAVGAGILAAGALPVIAVAALVIGGYIAAAYLVDGIDSHFKLKDRVAEIAR